MSTHHLPHVRPVIAFLTSIGALVSRVRHSKRIVIEWRVGGHHGVTRLPSRSGAPSSTAGRAIADIRRTVGLVGVAA